MLSAVLCDKHPVYSTVATAHKGPHDYAKRWADRRSDEGAPRTSNTSAICRTDPHVDPHADVRSKPRADVATHDAYTDGGSNRAADGGAYNQAKQHALGNTVHCTVNITSIERTEQQPVRGAGLCPHSTSDPGTFGFPNSATHPCAHHLATC